MRRILLVPLAVMGVSVSGCQDPNTTSYDPVGVAAADANLDLVPRDQISSCVESTKFGAFVGDAAALARWDSAGQSEAGVAAACLEIWRGAPSDLAAIHTEWLATQAAIDASP